MMIFLPVPYPGELFSSVIMRYLLYMPRGRKDSCLKYCPVCVRDDRRRYGEAYWHRVHQVQGMVVCPVHGNRLLESHVSRVSGYGALESAAEHVLPQEDTMAEKKDRGNALENRVAQYLAAVFLAPIQWDNPVATSDFLRYRMQRSFSVSSRGELVNLDGMLLEAGDFYQGFIGWPADMKSKVFRMYKGNSLPFLEICLLSLFLGITAEELTNPAIPARAQRECFDETVRQYHRDGMGYKNIAVRLGTTVSQVKYVCSGIYDREKSARAGKSKPMGTIWIGHV